MIEPIQSGKPLSRSISLPDFETVRLFIKIELLKTVLEVWKDFGELIRDQGKRAAEIHRHRQLKTCAEAFRAEIGEQRAGDHDSRQKNATELFIRKVSG